MTATKIHVPLSFAKNQCYPVSGIRYPVSAIRYAVSAIRYAVSGIRYPLSGIRYPVSGIRYPVSAIRYPVSRIRYPVSGIRVFHHATVRSFITINLKFKVKLANIIISNTYKNTICCQMMSRGLAMAL